MNILITGAKIGLGKYLAQHYKEKNNVAICSRTMKSEIRSLHFLTSKCDIRDIKEINHFLRTIKNYFQHIDVLINNAGIIKFDLIKDIKIKDLNNIIDTNLKGTILFTQAFLNADLKPKYIINIGSIRAITSAPHKTVYSASKFGLRAFTQSLNIEFPNIKSTLLCPGTFDLNNHKAIKMKDILKTLEYIFSLSDNAKIPEIVIGGQL